MKTKLIFFVAPIVIAGCLVAGLIVLRRPPSQRTASAPGSRVPAVAAATVVAPTVPAPEPSLPEDTAAPTESIPPEPPTKPKAPAAPAAQGAQPREERRDPLARQAMALVGVDPEAEAYWLEAINDPTLSDNEREDLIEDLNENGFSGGNGSRASVEDLPLIARRIRIIEELWPYAMDENNWNAFQEVYKDLTNMYQRLSQQ